MYFAVSHKPYAHTAEQVSIGSGSRPPSGSPSIFDLRIKRPPSSVNQDYSPGWYYTSKNFSKLLFTDFAANSREQQPSKLIELNLTE